MKTALTQLIDYIESSCTKGGYKNNFKKNVKRFGL